MAEWFFHYFKLQLPPGQAGLIIGALIIFLSTRKQYILHPTHIQALDSNHIKAKQVPHRERGSIHLISKNIDISKTDQLMISHNDQAKRFWIAQTYSGFCFETRALPKNEIGEYFGPHNTLSKKSRKKVVTIICKRVQSLVKKVQSIVKNQTANIIHAVALIALSFSTPYGAGFPWISNPGIICHISFEIIVYYL